LAQLRAGRDHLSERVKHLVREVGELTTLRQRVEEIEAKLAAQQMANQACDLRVHGIPFIEGENLRVLHNQLCFSLKLAPPPKIKVLFRARKSQISSVDPVVIIMENQHEKITLLRCIRAYCRAAKKQLSLHMIGFDSQAALYVNGQLLREHYVIFKEAMKLKKRRLLSAVFTRRGLVHVRCSDKIYCIESMYQLLALSQDLVADKPASPLSSQLSLSSRAATTSSAMDSMRWISPLKCS